MARKTRHGRDRYRDETWRTAGREDEEEREDETFEDIADDEDLWDDESDEEA